MREETPGCHTEVTIQRPTGCTGDTADPIIQRSSCLNWGKGQKLIAVSQQCALKCRVIFQDCTLGVLFLRNLSPPTSFSSGEQHCPLSPPCNGTLDLASAFSLDPGRYPLPSLSPSFPQQSPTLLTATLRLVTCVQSALSESLLRETMWCLFFCALLISCHIVACTSPVVEVTGFRPFLWHSGILLCP